MPALLVRRRSRNDGVELSDINFEFPVEYLDATGRVQTQTTF
jgi:hypothetical protein